MFMLILASQVRTGLNLVFGSFVLLTSPECSENAECSYGTCAEGVCKCKTGLVKEGRICKRGENIILQKYSKIMRF